MTTRLVLRSMACVGACAGMWACEEPVAPGAPSSQSAAVASAPKGPGLRAVAVGGEVAFELSQVGRRVFLFTGPPRGGVDVTLLDAEGAALGPGPAGRVHEGDARVIELGALSSDAGVALSWVEAPGLLWATRGSAEGDNFAPPERLGEVDLGSRSERGHLALARGQQGEALVFHRGGLDACDTGGVAQCTRFGVREIGAPPSRSRRSPLTVPSPCGVGVAAFATAPGRWYYGVCSTRDGSPTTTVFRVQFEPMYAETSPMLKGCTPRGGAIVEGELIVAADCKAGRRGARLRGTHRTVEEVDLGAAEVYCRRGRPALRAPGAYALDVSIEGIEGNLAALLPAAIAPAGSRALWTGVTLLVARFSAGAVRLARYECRAGRFAKAH